MNTHAPFCLVAVGVQGAGKSHTLSCVIENCLLDSPRDIAGDAGMAAVVFYYDQSPDNFCEAVTLSRPRGDLPAGMARAVKNVVVLVSPANFKRRKRVYENLGFPVAVKPLLFSWDDLDAADLQTLMHVDEMPLYMESVIDYLRSMQKADAKPNFAQFRAHIAEMDFTNAQRSPLELRLQLLASFLREDPSNAAYYAGQPDVSAVLRTPDQMVVVDLTDPLFSGEQANGVFAVVMAKFLSCPAAHGRLCVFDEAHKYMRPAGTDGLSRAVVSAVRQMRHLGVRTVVSTQSPRTLPAELLELASAAVVHRFHSQDWFDVLRARLRLPVSFADGVLGLETGEALVFTLRWGGGLAAPGEFVRRVKVRPRLTWDGGASRRTQERGGDSALPHPPHPPHPPRSTQSPDEPTSLPGMSTPRAEYSSSEFFFSSHPTLLAHPTPQAEKADPMQGAAPATVAGMGT
ncbi:hypothetical protein DFJ74DRAFT_743292, partial [Hyaloraphidium curvatum]